METSIDWFIKDEVLQKKPLNFNQYGYSKGVSAEMTLHAFISRIEAQLELGNLAEAIFKDAETACHHLRGGRQ